MRDPSDKRTGDLLTGAVDVHHADDPTVASAEAVIENVWGKPESCRRCTLFLEPGIVRGSGNRNAKIIYLAEAPGAEEVDWPAREGWNGKRKVRQELDLSDQVLKPGLVGFFRQKLFRPLIGGAGRILNAMLAHAGISRDSELFVTNCVKCRPPSNRTPTKHEIICCAPFLMEEIQEVNPNVIIAAGETALSVLTDKQKIGLWRGVVTVGPKRDTVEARDGSGVSTFKVFPTWHPAFIARAQQNWPFAVHDLARAKVESGFSEIVRVPINIIRNASIEAHGGTLLADARARRAATFDFETTGLTPEYDQILMCGLVARPDQGEVYDWTPGAQRLFQEVLDSPEVTIIGQNILYFDGPFAIEKGFRFPWLRVFDTMVAFHLCNASYGQATLAEGGKSAVNKGGRGAEKDLSMIASCHTDIEYWKSREMYGNDLKGVCGLDVIATDRSATHPETGLMAELERYDMTDLYWKHVVPVHPVLYSMTKAGVKINQEKAAAWSVALEAEADRLEAVLKEGLGDLHLNLGSPKQLQALLYDKMGLPPQYVTDRKGTRVTTNAEALEALAIQFPEHAVLGSIVTIRHLRKMSSTYCEPGLQSADSRLHPRFGVSKAATGRFNSQGPNAQNVPEEMRDIWIPDSDEHVLISADWSQIEWRLAMILSGDPVGLALLTSGQDTHKATAAETLGKRIEDITDTERHRSKFIVYGLGYGRGADSIAEANNWELSWVKAFIDRFFARFAVFAAWRERNVEFVKKNHFLANSFKRRRWWYTYQVTEVYNFPQQSEAGDMMYEILVTIANQLPKGADLRLTVHDETVTNVAKDVIRDAWTCIRDCMERMWPEIVEASADPEVVKRFYPNGWYCPADLHVGTTWEMTKSKKPELKAQSAKLQKELGLA
jgi:uracil-DNA glycosylase family 4